MSDQCEGCDQPGTIDWHGTWLCAACKDIEEAEANPVLAAQLEAERRQKEALEWPAHLRGDSPESMRDWNVKIMAHWERGEEK